ncbi:hypothetical protein DFS34DRAFT_693050, partial [Phlyctochytrium arcticum]
MAPSLTFSSSTGSSGTLQEQLKIASSGVVLSNTADLTSGITGGLIVKGGVAIAKKLYIAAIPLSNYTLLSTYNARQTVIDNKFTPIETRLLQLKALSNKDTIDLSSADVTGILPIAKVDTNTLQPIITSANAASIRATLGLSSTASSGIVDWSKITNIPPFGLLSVKNAVDLSTSETIGNLDFTRIANVPSYVSQSVYYDRINQLGTLVNKSVIDLSTNDVANILPAIKVDLSSRQPLDTTLSALSMASPSISKSLTLTNSISGSNSPNLTLLGAGGSLNSVSIQMSPWSGRPGGIRTKIAAIDDNVGGARLSLQAASGGDSTPLTEFLSGTSSSVIIPITTDSTSSTSGALQVRGGARIAKSLSVGNSIVSYSTLNSGVLRLASYDNANYIQSGLQNTTGSSAPLIFSSINGGTSFMVLDSASLRINHTSDTNGLMTGSLIVNGGVQAAKTVACTELMKIGHRYFLSSCNTTGYISANNQQSPLSVGTWGVSSNVQPGTYYLSVPLNGVYTITASIMFDGSGTPQVQYLTNATQNSVLTMNRGVTAPLTWTGYLVAGTNLSWTVKAPMMANLGIPNGSSIIICLLYQ